MSATLLHVLKTLLIIAVIESGRVERVRHPIPFHGNTLGVLEYGA